MGAQAVRLSNVDIDNALKERDFEVLFQPIFDLGNGALARMESFVRWRHPRLGVLPPGAFISFFENQGRMSELTRYVLAAALAAYTRWRGPFAPGFSINLALSDLSDDSFSIHFEKLLRDRDFPADLITLECPMPAVDAEYEQAMTHFARLRGVGARLAIEVRGQANDFLRGVDPFPFDEIKTGGSSILRFARTVRGPGLSAISDLLDIANRANAAITAVGVEDQASLGALRGLGFTAAQGNHLAKVGALTDFRPGRVNEVRVLLGLAPLSGEDLAALFRTSPPAPKAADADGGDAVIVDADVVEEIAEDVDESAEEPIAVQLDNGVGDQVSIALPPAGAGGDEAEKRALAREKAKALALAKRAKQRAARKVAAIRRAKAKAAARADAGGEAAAAQGGADQTSAAIAPRDLQERLAQEFAEASSKTVKEEKAVMDGKPASTPEETRNPKQDALARSAKEVKAEEQEEVRSSVKKLAKAIAGAPRAEQKAASPLAAPPAGVRLAVAGAGAYFQPGIRVGGPVMNPRLETRGVSPPSPPAQEESPAKAAPPDQPAPAKAEPVAALTREEEDAIEHAAAQSERESFVDHFEEAAPRRKRKTFLTRRYRFGLPNHFWPKSWRRRYRRWRADRAAMREARGTQAAE